MACGDRKAAFRVAILDPEVTVSQPRPVTAVTGIDAIAHAVESYVCTRRNPLSQMSRCAAWRLLEPNFETVLREPDDLAARGRDADRRLPRGHGHRERDARRLPRLRQPADGPLRHDARHRRRHHAAARHPLQRTRSPARCTPTWSDAAGLPDDRPAGEVLAERVAELSAAAGLPGSLKECGVSDTILPVLAEEANQQWTARFNPRPVTETDILKLYQAAW